MRPIRFLILLLVGVALGCGDVPQAQRPATAGSEAAWRRHEEHGLSLLLPPAWSLSDGHRDGRVEARGPGGEQLIIWPVYVPGTLDATAGARVARRLASRLRPDASWSEPEAVGARAVRLRGSHAGRSLVAALSWTPSSKGSAAELVVLETAVASNAGQLETIARALESLELSGPELEEPQPARFVRWTDPHEAAFSLEIPAGWRATGGTVRPAPLLVQAGVDVRSPDGEVSLLMSDAFPLYVEPNWLLASQGIGAGGTYVDPMGYQWPVQPYAPGLEFLKGFFLMPRLGEGYAITRQEEREELGRELSRAGLSSFDAGELEYSFQRAGKLYRGGALCITERLKAQAGSSWHVWRLYLAEAPAERYDEAAAALARLASSLVIDKKWARMQAGLTARQSRVIAEMGEAVGATITSGYASRQASLDALAERRSRATLEVEDVVDPATGRSWRVEAGSSYYWVAPDGAIVGTDTLSRPDVDFRRLLTLP